MIKQIGGYAHPVIKMINGRKFSVTPVIEELSHDINPQIREKIQQSLAKIKEEPFQISGVFERKMANGDVAILVNRDAYNIYKVSGNIDKLMIFKPDGTVKVKSSSFIPQREQGADVKKFTSIKSVINNGIAIFKESLSKIFVNKKQTLMVQDIYTPKGLYRYQLSDDSLISKTYGEGFGTLGNYLEKNEVMKREFESNGNKFVEYSQIKKGNYLIPSDAQI